MNKWVIAGAWLVIAALATTVTWQIVNAADAQVSERPPLQVDPPEVTTTDPSTTASSTDASTTSSSSTTTSTTAPGSGSTSSTTPGSSSTSATPATTAAWSNRTIPTSGGVVVVSYRPDEVVLSSATPAPGFAAEIKDPGPPDVDVEFESESSKVRVRARWENGALSVETDED